MDTPPFSSIAIPAQEFWQRPFTKEYLSSALDREDIPDQEPDDDEEIPLSKGLLAETTNPDTIKRHGFHYEFRSSWVNHCSDLPCPTIDLTRDAWIYFFDYYEKWQNVYSITMNNIMGWFNPFKDETGLFFRVYLLVDTVSNTFLVDTIFSPSWEEFYRDGLKDKGRRGMDEKFASKKP